MWANTVTTKDIYCSHDKRIVFSITFIIRVDTVAIVTIIAIVTIGSRAFSVSGPQTWNQLPEEITSAASLSTFQRHLKTFLFRKSFPDIIADWHFSGTCGNLNYLGHSKKNSDWLIDWLQVDWLIDWYTVLNAVACLVVFSERNYDDVMQLRLRDLHTACCVYLYVFSTSSPCLSPLFSWTDAIVPSRRIVTNSRKTANTLGPGPY